MNWYNIKNNSDETIIDITGVIGGGFFEDGVTAEQVYSDLKEFRNIKSNRITVNIVNCPGGSVMHGLAIYDLINGFGATINTKGIGLVASMASVLFMLGSKRELTPNTLFLAHTIRGGFEGNIIELKQALGEWETIQDRLIDILSSRSGNSKEVIEGYMNLNNGEGEFWDAEKTKEIGFATKVDTKIKLAACIDKEFLEKYNLNNIKIKDFENLETFNNNFNMTESEKKSFIKNIADTVVGMLKKDEHKNKEVSELVATTVKEIEAKFKEENDSLTAKVEALNTEKTRLESNVETLTSEKTGLETKVTELQTIIDKNDANGSGGEGQDLDLDDDIELTEEDLHAKKLVEKIKS